MYKSNFPLFFVTKKDWKKHIAKKIAGKMFYRKSRLEIQFIFRYFFLSFYTFFQLFLNSCNFLYHFNKTFTIEDEIEGKKEKSP